MNNGDEQKDLFTYLNNLIDKIGEADLADKLQVSLKTLSDWMYSSRFPYDHLIKRIKKLEKFAETSKLNTCCVQCGEKMFDQEMYNQFNCKYCMNQDEKF